MRIEQNLLHRNLHTNGHQQNNGTGLYARNNNSTTTQNRRNQGKEVGQDIHVRKSTLQETENGEKTSFLNPELQRELNRILAEAESDGKLSQDSEDSPSTSSSSVSSASSEEEDEYEHPRRLFLEEIAEEDEEESVDDDEDVEEEEEEDEEELSDKDDSDEEAEEQVEENDKDGESKEKDLDVNNANNPLVAVDDTGELEGECSDIASDSDATITNECIGEEIETDHEIRRKVSQVSSSVRTAVTKLFNKEQEEKKNEKQARILFKVENDDRKSAVENEWGNEQIDETPKETGAEHARRETGISTETDYQEPVESEQQYSYHQPHCFNHFHKQKYSKQTPQYKQTDETYNTCADADRESVSEVSQQPFEFHQQHKEKQHEHLKELLLDQTQPEENTKSARTRTTYSVAGQVDEDVENDDDDDDEDDDDDDGESSCNSSTISTSSSSSSSSSSGSGSSIEALEELEQEQQKQHGNVEIRLFHDVGSAIASKSTSNNISREWNRESKCRAVLVDLQATTSTEVHELVPESPGESGTGSSSSLSSSASPSFPLKSSLLSSTPINSNCLRSEATTKKDVSVGDSCTNNTFTRLPLHTIIKDNNNSSDSCNTPVSPASTSNTPQNSSPAPLIPPKSFPSILITSPKSSPPTSSTSTGTVAPKKKRVSFQEQVESKTYFAGDEPSSVSSSDSDFSKKEDLVDTNFAHSETKPDLTVEQELNSSSSHPSYGTTVYNNSQFSTADFWALRNGGRDSSQQKQYLQSLYYSESENSSEAEYHQLQQKSKQQYRQPITNHHYYYPSEYFTLSDTFAQNSSLGLPPTESASSACAHQSWKTHESKQQQQQSNQEQQLDIHSTRTAAAALAPLPTSPTTRPTSVLDNNRNAEMHQRLSGGEQRLRSVLRKPGVGGVKKTRGERSVTFNESLNLFYEAECSCWIHEDDYHRLRQEEQAQQQQHQQQHHQHHQQFIYEQTHPQYPHTHQNFIYEPPPIEFEDPPTLSPPEGYKDRFFPQEDPTDPDVTRVCPPSPPSARRKVFLKENSTDQLPPPPPQQKGVILNGLEDEEEDEESRKSNSGSGNSSGTNTSSSKGSRLGGILKGGRLWRSNSAEGKKVTSPPDEPDVVKCTERDSRERLSDKDPSDRTNAVSVGTSSPQAQVQTQEPHSSYQGMPTKVSTGTAPLRTSEQIRLAVDSTLRLRTKKTKPECSSLVEKLRWLTSLDDDDPSDSSSQSGFATWPSRDKNGSVSSGSSSKKSDAGTSTNEEFVNSAGIRQPPPIYSSNEAKIKQISYTLEDIDEGLKGSEIELESFITEDGGRIERLKKRYSGEEPGDDYGFSRRPSVKGIKPKFSSTNQIFAQYTAMRASGTETPVPVESQYENTRGLPPPASFDQLPNHHDGARMQLNYEVQSTTGRPAEESRAHFEMIRQSFEHASFSNFNRPHSWSVSTLPHPHHTHAHSNSISLSSTASPVPQPSGGVPPNLLSNNFGSTLSVSQQPMTQQQQQQQQQHQQQQHQQQQQQIQQQQQQQQNNLSMNPSPINMNNAAGGVRGADGVPMMAGNPGGPIYGTLPSGSHMIAQQNQMPQPGQPIYGTVRRVPNVIGRPLFLHYGALSVEAHPNKIVQPFPRPTKVPETPSPTQQPPPLLKYYGPPIRYYNSPPPVPPRSVTTTVGGGMGNQNVPGNGVTPSGMGNQTMADCQQERGVPEGATDEEPSLKESYSMNV